MASRIPPPHPVVAGATEFASSLANGHGPMQAATNAGVAAVNAHVSQNGVVGTASQALGVVNSMPPLKGGNPSASTGTPITLTHGEPGMVLLFRVLDPAKARRFVEKPTKDDICTTGEKGDFHANGSPEQPSYWTNSKVYANELLRRSAGKGKVVVFQHFPVSYLSQAGNYAFPANPGFPATPEKWDDWVDYVSFCRGGTELKNRRIAWKNVCIGPVSNCGDSAYSKRAMAGLKDLQARVDNFQPYWIGEHTPEQREAILNAGNETVQEYEAGLKARKGEAKYALQYVFLAQGLVEICKPAYARGFCDKITEDGAGKYTWSYSSGGKFQSIPETQYDYNPIEHMLHENPASMNASVLAEMVTRNCKACQALSKKVTS